MDELTGELPFVQEDIDSFRQYCLQNAYRRERLKKGDVLQVPTSGSCCFLHKGRLKVFIGTDSGNERLMWFLESGNIIPEGSGETFSKRLVADADTEVLYLTEKEVYAFALSGEDNVAELLRHYKKRYILLLQSILQEHEESSRSRVYRFLYQIAISYGKESPEGLFVEKLPSRSDIGALLGIHRSNVTRYFSDLEKLGIVTKQKKSLIIHDIKSLEELIRQENEE